MNITADDLSVEDVLKLKSGQMLVVNPEYQRGAVWTPSQQKKLVDSVMRGYPIPLIYLHHISQSAGKLKSERYEVIDGQQRINALADFAEGAFKLFDPIADEAEARFPDFIRKKPCPWGGKAFDDMAAELQARFLATGLRIVRIETHDSNEARDLFVRLQAGMPLNAQEKRDAWPGQFTDFVLRLGGKAGIARYPGHDFFNVLMKAQRSKDRGKFRQLAAQIAMLFLARRRDGAAAFRDTNAPSIDDFYYENLGFDAKGEDAQHLTAVMDKITSLLRDQQRSKLLGHEAIHLVLLVDALFDDYTRSWEAHLANAFDAFREEFAKAKATRDQAQPSEYWLQYGVLTRVNSDRGDTIQQRHEFFVSKMIPLLHLQAKDPERVFGAVEKELIYYRDRKLCGVCGATVSWDEAEFHHVHQHAKGGRTLPENGALVHKHCHPKGAAADRFAEKWAARKVVLGSLGVSRSDPQYDDEGDDDNGDS